MRGEVRVPDDIIARLSPVALAQFIDMKWFTDWPHTASRAGRRAWSNGYGSRRNEHGHLQLPIVTDRSARDG